MNVVVPLEDTIHGDLDSSIIKAKQAGNAVFVSVRISLLQQLEAIISDNFPEKAQILMSAVSTKDNFELLDFMKQYGYISKKTW